MREVQIEIENAVECSIPKMQARFIAPAIEYKKSYWKKTQRGMREETYSAHFFIHKGRDEYTFLTGHLGRVIKFCREHNVYIKVNGDRPSRHIKNAIEPHLNGITLREDQLNAIKTATMRKRGVVKYPTRTGKTIIQYGLVSAFNSPNTLFLAHTVDLVEQLAEEGRRFGFNVAICHGTQKDVGWEDHHQVVVMTRSTAANEFSKDNGAFLSNFFDMIIIDEAHHVINSKGQYARILTASKAPLRYGFTATLPDTREGRMTLEGYVGNTIKELTIHEAIDRKLLVNPKIHFEKAPKVKINVATKYDMVYDDGIVYNRSRNRRIAQIASDFMKDKKSVLILVTKIDHGHHIEGELQLLGRDVRYVFGETPKDKRKQAKKDLIKKKLLCVICTTVWKEGINIPSLDVCINAGGGRSEISTLQGVGRSLTRTKDKTQAIIVDFFDVSHHYLIRHFGERMTLYFDQGWM